MFLVTHVYSTIPKSPWAFSFILGGGGEEEGKNWIAPSTHGFSCALGMGYS